jgi:hypothetical protein
MRLHFTNRKRSTLKKEPGNQLRVLLILLWAVLATGCAILPETPDRPAGVAAGAPDSPEALSLLEALQKTNDPLRTFKGIGRLTIRQGGKIQLDGRIAWVGSDPRKLSVVLSASGFPAMRMAIDGEWLYYQDPQDPSDPIKRFPSADPDLKRLLSIPIHASDIITLLCGRVPLKEHRSARLQPPQAAGSGQVLLLSKIWGVHQKVFFDPQKETVRYTEVYDSSGALVYQAHFQEMQQLGPYRVPVRLAVLNSEKVEVLLVVENYWADVPVSPSMFVLPPPG